MGKQLEKNKNNYQQRIQQKEKKLQNLREEVKIHKRSAQKAVEDSERIFTELIRSFERSRSEVTQLIRDQEHAAVSRVEERLERLEQEIEDLRRRNTELEQLSHTEDHIHFLQSFRARILMPVLSFPEFRITASSLLYDDVVKSVSLLKEKLEDFCTKETKQISDRVQNNKIIPISEDKVKQLPESRPVHFKLPKFTLNKDRDQTL